MNQEELNILIQRTKQGDSKTFSLLVKEYQPLVFRLAFRLLCDEDDAKDVVQDTFVKIWLGIDKYNPQFKFSTWIYKITANICYDRLKSALYINKIHQKKEFQIPSGENIESTIINNDLREHILQLTKELSPKQKMIFMLRDVEELEIDEVTVITGLSADKIKSNLYLARKYIRNKITR